MQKNPKKIKQIKRMMINIEIKNKLKDNLIFMIERWNWTNKYWKDEIRKRKLYKKIKNKK
jgi:hypothetical protein